MVNLLIKFSFLFVYKKFYTNCKCDHHHPDSSDNIIIRKKIIAKPGICPSKCNTLTLYVIIFSLSALIISTSEVGAMLLTLRCVEPRDKAMALGFISFATGLFGMFHFFFFYLIQKLTFSSL